MTLVNNFSALSNEANLRGLQEAWLIFGISDDKRYVGTEFRKQGRSAKFEKGNRKWNQ